MIQTPTFNSIPVPLEQADPQEMEGLSPREDALIVTDTIRAGEVEKSEPSKDENQLKEEALLNAVIEIEALIKTAAQAANQRSEQGRGVRSEIEDLRRTQERRIDEAFDGRATQEQSRGEQTSGFGEESLQNPEWEFGHSTEETALPADSSQRSLGLTDLERLGREDAFHVIARAFDDQSQDVRNAAARALFELQPDRVASFAQVLRESSPDRRRRVTAALAASGLAGDAIGNLAGQTREQGYEAFSLLFLMTKAGEVQPLLRAVEEHPNIEVRLAVVRLLALNGQSEIVPSFRHLAVRGVLPSEVRTAVIEAIYELGRQIPRDILSGERLSTDIK